MGEALITRRGAGSPKPPASYTFLQLVTSSLNWTVPADGWYKVYCVGKSGNGGSGGSASPEQNRAGGGGGSGGNSGGVSISVLMLKAGTAIPITVNVSTSSFGNYLSATAGANGLAGANGNFNATSPGAQPSSAVGQAYGGNFQNHSGNLGGYGGNGSLTRDPFTPSTPGQSIGNNTGGQGSGSDYRAFPAGGGGAGADYNGLNIYQGTQNLSGGSHVYKGSSVGTTANQAPLTPPSFEGSGGGGSGGSGWLVDYTTGNPGGGGGLGSPGGIIIEKGVN